MGGIRRKSRGTTSECVICGGTFKRYSINHLYCGEKECKAVKQKEHSTKWDNGYKRKQANADFKNRNPYKAMLNNVKYRGLQFDLDEAWIKERLDNGKCEATGIGFFIEPYGKRVCGFSGRNPWQPTIDKINPDKGYTKANCQMVVWAYNIAKSTWDGDVVVMMAKALVAKGA